MAPLSIYTLYDITNQAKQILNTYPNDSEEIIIHGLYIYLHSKIVKAPLTTNIEYNNFYNNIINHIQAPFDPSNEIQIAIRKSCDDYFMSNHLIPTYDSCRWKIDLGKFTCLKTIKISYLYLDEVINIPDGLIEMNIQYCFLKKLNDLPTSLQILYCNDNQLTRLPHLQHTNLVELYFKNNNVYQMPHLPNSIKELVFNKNQIINIPNFPKSLKYLECSWNRIHNLNNLPKNINTIICDHNDIVKLPCLSGLNFLKTLVCNSNEISEMPPLPGLIEYIDYSDNPINLFVPFPHSLIG